MGTSLLLFILWILTVLRHKSGLYLVKSGSNTESMTSNFAVYLKFVKGEPRNSYHTHGLQPLQKASSERLCINSKSLHLALLVIKATVMAQWRKGMCREREVGTISAFQDEGQDSEKTWRYTSATAPFAITLFNIKVRVSSQKEKNHCSNRHLGRKKGYNTKRTTLKKHGYFSPLLLLFHNNNPKVPICNLISPPSSMWPADSARDGQLRPVPDSCTKRGQFKCGAYTAATVHNSQQSSAVLPAELASPLAGRTSSGRDPISRALLRWAHFPNGTYSRYLQCEQVFLEQALNHTHF